MTRTRSVLGALVGAVLLLGTACLGGAEPTPTSATQPTRSAAAASPTPEAKATPNSLTPSGDWCTPVLAAGATPTPTPPVNRRLGPPVMALIAGECEQEGSIGSFFWQLGSEVAADVNAPGLQIQAGPLALQRGQTVRFDPRVGPVPAKLTLIVYPQQGNVRPLEELPNAQGTPQIGTPIPGSNTPDVFKPTTEPVTTVEIPVDALSWTVDLEPGRYFLHLKGEWPNPQGQGRQLTGEYSFFVRVE
ncbi:MAG: hypothetical protein QJR03_05785 [Sphaerobacter sp.]|nr:hypothetical protein [Sphaerobacter sp.]